MLYDVLDTSYTNQRIYIFIIVQENYFRNNFIYQNVIIVYANVCVLTYILNVVTSFWKDPFQRKKDVTAQIVLFALKYSSYVLFHA